MDNTTSETTDFRFRRKPWTAVALSLLLPGLGHIYCGDMKSGLVVIMIIMMFPLLWMVGTLKEGRVIGPFACMMWGIVFLATLLAAIHSWYLARRTRYDYRPKDYNRWDVYLCLLAISVGGTLWYAIYFRDKVVEAFCVPSRSMFPSIRQGDRLLASKLAYQRADPVVGDVILFTNPADRRQSFLKRIVALAGDTIESRQGRLWINGKPLEYQSSGNMEYPDGTRIEKGEAFQEINRGRCYTIFLAETGDSENAQKDFGPIQVPPYHCFVMGDNRYLSLDSRHFGTIPLVSVRGQFTGIYYPAGDWSRFGSLP